MLLRVCSVRKHVCDRRWEEWVERRWEEVGRVEEVARGETSWDELRRVKTRCAEVRVAEKSWEEQGRGEKSHELRWEEMEQVWELSKRVAKIEKSWDGLRKVEKWWSKLKGGKAKWRIHRTELKGCEGPLHLLCANLVFGSYTAPHFLNLETSATRLAKVLVYLFFSIYQ